MGPSVADENAVAVLGEDSDYLAFGVDYIPLASLNWENETSQMGGNFYSAKSVAQALGIAPQVRHARVRAKAFSSTSHSHIASSTAWVSGRK